MKIERLTNRDKTFYPTLGPFLARREVEKEIGYPVYDDDDKSWFIALNGKEVLGFCYLQEKKKGHYQIGSCYVVSGHRHKGIFRSLLNEAMGGGINGSVILITRNEYLMELLTEEGFIENKKRGSFIEYLKELSGDETV